MDYSSLDKNSSEQLYLQIRRMLLHAIREQELQPKQRVPSANELSQKAGISRMTVRQALATLVQEGWLYTVPGKGTFVAERPHVEQNLQNLQGWSEEIRAQGLQPSTHLISVGAVAADRTTAQHLRVQPGALVHQITRVRYADNFALSVEKAHLLFERFPEIASMIQQPNASLYTILRQAYGVNPTRAVQFLEAGEVFQAEADLLEIKTGSPVLISERITYAIGDDPIEYVYGITRPGFVRYKTELSAGSSTVRQIIVPIEGQADHERNGK